MPELDLGNVKGPQGKSAYQSALDAGYSGSEEAFNTAMAKAPDAVLYTAQSLTDEQKAQARTNIGADTVQGAVLYTPQTLSDGQKTQARGNINAAPGGFGWGDSTGQSILDANEAILGGFYYWGPNAKNTPFRYGAMVVIPRSSNTAKPDVTQIASEDTGAINPISSIAVRKSTDNDDGAWGEWEYVNPPMMPGVEYRTTERHLGEPVYCKILEVSPITDGYRLTIGARKILRTSVYEVYNDSYIPVPHVPAFFKSSSLPDASGMAYYTNVNEIVFAHGASNGSTKAVVTVYYTK